MPGTENFTQEAEVNPQRRLTSITRDDEGKQANETPAHRMVKDKIRTIRGLQSCESWAVGSTVNTNKDFFSLGATISIEFPEFSVLFVTPISNENQSDLNLTPVPTRGVMGADTHGTIRYCD